MDFKSYIETWIRNPSAPGPRSVHELLGVLVQCSPPLKAEDCLGVAVRAYLSRRIQPTLARGKAPKTIPVAPWTSALR